MIDKWLEVNLANVKHVAKFMRLKNGPAEI